MDLQDFDFVLPKELIAQQPAKQRTDSRLLVSLPNKLEHRGFRDICEYLKEDDVLVINESRVLPAMIETTKATGGRLKLILTAKNHGCYDAFVKGRLRQGVEIPLGSGLSLKVIKKHEAFAIIKPNKRIDLFSIGRMPIPPYIKKQLRNQSRYQTVYGRQLGSIAAHTAGLHFDRKLLQRIKRKGVKIARVCLHISYSTFFPVRGTIERHRMLPELCSIDSKNAKIINNRKGRLIAVGTTVVKTLESFSDYRGMIRPGKKHSDLFIYPPYRFKIKFDGLVTNFHFPKSTLLLLVSALFERERILEIYREAIRRRYRFYSFGDACLLLRE